MKIKRVDLGKKTVKSVILAALTFLVSLPVLSQSTDLFPVPESYQVEGIPPILKSEVEHLFLSPGLSEAI